MSRIGSREQRLVMGSPLTAARAELDDARGGIRRGINGALRDGVSLTTLLAEPLNHPAQERASEVLDAAISDGKQDWTEYIHLKLALATMRQRVFEPFVFSTYADDSHRSYLHAESCGQSSGLLEEVMAIRDVYTSEQDRGKIAGSVAELMVHALLNRASPSSAGVSLSTAKADRLHKVDARYRVVASSGTPVTANLQVKTWGETEELPNKVLQLGLYNVLGGAEEGLATERLIVGDLHAELSDAQQSQLVDRARNLQAAIHESSLFKRRVT